MTYIYNIIYHNNNYHNNILLLPLGELVVAHLLVRPLDRVRVAPLPILGELRAHAVQERLLLGHLLAQVQQASDVVAAAVAVEGGVGPRGALQVAVHRFVVPTARLIREEVGEQGVLDGAASALSTVGYEI